MQKPWDVVHIPPSGLSIGDDDLMPAPGWSGVGVSLTHGLCLLQHPELVVFDVPSPQASGYLDRLAERVARGQAFTSGTLLYGLHHRFRFGLVEIADDEALRVLAERSGTGSTAPMLQLVWPDICGTLPWEHGYDPHISGLTQPVLGTWPHRSYIRSLAQTCNVSAA